MKVEIDSLTAPLWFPSWPKIVEDYSQRQLTNPNDRLPAIAGLARRFQCVNEDEFLAGLWKSKLHIGLLWRRVPSKSDTLEPSSPNEHRPPRRTPSWSWISTNKAVEVSRKLVTNHTSLQKTCFSQAHSVSTVCGRSTIARFPLLMRRNYSAPWTKVMSPLLAH